MTGSIPGIDLARISAAFMVMLYHFFYWDMRSPEYHAAFSGVANPAVLEFMHFGWVGVEIFFVISGIVIHRSASRSSWTKFLYNRVLRLAPAVWICAPISIVCGIILGNISPDGYMRPLLNGLFFQPLGPWPDAVYWTLGIECSFYLLTVLCLALGRFNWLKAIVLVLSAISTTYWVAYFFFYTSWPVLEDLRDNRFFQLALLRHAPFFAVGILLSEFRSNRKANKLLFLCASYSILGCLGEIWGSNDSINFWAKDNLSASVPILIWIGFVILLGMATLFQNESRNRRIERTLGLATYPLYLVHAQLGVVTAATAHVSGLAAAPSLALGIVVPLALSFLIAVRIEPWVAEGMKKTIDTCLALISTRAG